MVNRTVQAAGGLLWRPGDDGLEIALVHRPKYDDWSLPKGKLEPGEHPLVAALREVEEETGSVATLGRPLGRTRYVKDGTPKRVTYWALRHASGDFEASDEVDMLEWVDPDEALARVHPDHDRRIVKELLRDTRPTRAAVVVRHASAGSRHAWHGRDAQRPLDKRGREQARGLVALLDAFAVTRAVSADVTRCVETLQPWAEAAGVEMELESLLSENGYAAAPRAADKRLTALVRTSGPAAFCTQGGALPDLVEHTCRAMGHRVRLDAVRKGALVVLHLADGADGGSGATGEPDLLAVDQLPPP